MSTCRETEVAVLPKLPTETWSVYAGVWCPGSWAGDGGCGGLLQGIKKPLGAGFSKNSALIRTAAYCYYYSVTQAHILSLIRKFLTGWLILTLCDRHIRTETRNSLGDLVPSPMIWCLWWGRGRRQSRPVKDTVRAASGTPRLPHLFHQTSPAPPVWKYRPEMQLDVILVPYTHFH